MKGHKTIMVAVMLVLIGILMAWVVSASSVTVEAPATSGTVGSDTYYLNASMTNTTEDGLLNCTFSGYSASTANSSSVNINQTVYNVSAPNTTTLNMTWDVSVHNLEDANNYVIAVSCYNTSGTELTDTSTGVIIDRTTPTTPSSLAPVTETEFKNSSEGDGIRFSATVTGSETTGCTMTISSFGSEVFTMTHSGNTCTYDKTYIPDGLTSFTVTASDGTNTSATTVNNIQFSASGSLTARTIIAQNVKPTKQPGLIDNQYIGIAILVAIGAYFLLFKGKKRKGLF